MAHLDVEDHSDSPGCRVDREGCDELFKQQVRSAARPRGPRGGGLCSSGLGLWNFSQRPRGQQDGGPKAGERGRLSSWFA